MRGRPSVLRRSGRRARPTFPLNAEVLEGRQLLVTFTVLTTADAGIGSLRQAILDANSIVNPGPDRIDFAILGAVGTQTIALLSPLPAITEAVVIDGASQPGFTATPIIELNGSQAGVGTRGLQLASDAILGTTSSGSTIRGLIVNRFSGAGVLVLTSDNAIVGNYLGTNAAGTTSLPNGGAGVDVRGGDNNTIGGLTDADRNVISGNSGNGVSLFNTAPRGNVVQGNYIGTTANGAAPLGNLLTGIQVQFANNNLIGGATAEARNVIAGNAGDGIRLSGSNGNRVEGNFIGVDVSGTLGRANGDSGIFIENSSLNSIGGATPAQRNLISANGADGVSIQDQSGSAGGTFSSPDVPRRIPPILTGGTGIPAQDTFRSNLTISTIAGAITDLNFNYSATHTFDIDIVARLIAPDGTTVLLTNMRGGNGDNYFNTTFDDEATVPISAGFPPFTGSFRPETPLSDLDGLNPNGLWQLEITDTIGIGTGTLLNWSLIIEGGLPAAPSSSNVILGNFIGTDRTGTQDRGNLGSGIDISSGFQNVIGGTASGARNVISGNSGSGVRIAGGPVANTLVQGNFIGTDLTGTQALGNQDGISLSGGDQTVIGGAAPGARNVISGNSGSGVRIAGGPVIIAAVQGNLIGTDLTGTLALGNSLAGVDDQSGVGTLIGPGNVISANNAGGVGLSGTATAAQVQGNLIGTDAAGTQDLGNVGFGVRVATNNNTIGGTAGAGNVIAFTRPAPLRLAFGMGVTVAPGRFGNSILFNSIFSNAGLGIDLNDDGAVQLNDADDLDFGANNGQNFPEIDSAGTGIVAGNTLIQGSLNSSPNAVFTLQFFTNPANGSVQGRTFIGSTDVTTDGSGNASFNVAFPVDSSGQFITATATSAQGNTSEFSTGVAAIAAPVTDLAVAIVAIPPQGMINEILTFMVTVSNNSPLDATGVVLTDLLPLGVSFVSAATSQGSVALAGGIVAADLGTVPSGATATVNIQVRPTAVGTLTNQARVATALTDIDLSNNTARLDITVGAPAGTNAVRLLSPTFNALEADGTAVITVIRSSSAGTTTVNFATSDGTARAGSDYTASSGTLTFNSGEFVQTFTIPIANDFVLEADETVLVTLSSPSGGILSTPLSAVLTIRDNDPTPTGAGSFRFGSPTYEVDENANIFQRIVVERIDGKQGDVAVDFATADLTARAGIDYVPRQFTITFADNDDAPKFLFVQVLNDNVDQLNKTVNLILSNPGRFRIQTDSQGNPVIMRIPVDAAGGPIPRLAGPSQAVLTIIDVLPPPSSPQTVMFNAAAYAVDEGARTATIIVTRSGSDGQVQVGFATSDGTALAGINYTDTMGTLTFNPGQTQRSFTIPILNTSTQEGNRTLNVTLSNPSTNASIAIPSTVVLTVVDDETPQPPIIPSVAFTAAAYTANETDGTATLIVSRPDFTSTATVDFATLGGTAAAGIKYVPTTGTLVFNPNETAKVFTIQINNTNQFEGTQTVIVGLINPSATSLGVPSTAVLSILDDEAPPPPVLRPGIIQFDAATYSVAENAGAVTITLVRTGGSDGMVSVVFDTPVSTTAPGRFSPVSTTVVFADGQTSATVTIAILDNAIIDGDPTLGLVLSAPTGGAALGNQATATLTILDNESDLIPPTVTDLQLIGNARTITAVVLSFSEPLDVARATNLANFSFLSLGRDGIRGTRDDQAVGAQSVGIDPATGNLTVVPARPLSARLFTQLIVNAAAPAGLADVRGNLLDGDADRVAGGNYVASFARSPRLQYTDSNGDAVNLRLARGGSLDLVRRADGEGDHLRLLNPVQRRSVLSGSVRRRRRGGDGRTTLQTLIGLDPLSGVRSRLRTPPFFIGRIVPAGVASLLAQDGPRVDRRSLRS